MVTMLCTCTPPRPRSSPTCDSPPFPPTIHHQVDRAEVAAAVREAAAAKKAAHLTAALAALDAGAGAAAEAAAAKLLGERLDAALGGWCGQKGWIVPPFRSRRGRAQARDQGRSKAHHPRPAGTSSVASMCTHAPPA